MRRFEFGLEGALRLRRRLEEQAQVELAEKQRVLERERLQLGELRQEIARHDVCRAGLQRSAVDVEALVVADRYGEALSRALWAQEERVAAAGAAVQICLEGLHRRRTDREALERLRERRLSEHRREELRVEQSLLDETAVLRRRR